jgi:hypothetical protein
MVRSLRFALPLVLIALLLGSATPAAAGWDWAPLTNDIQRLAPAVLQTSLLAKVDAAMAATDRGNFCAAVNILGALVNQLDGGLGGPDTIGEPGLRELEADIAAVLRSLPDDSTFCSPQPHR